MERINWPLATSGSSLADAYLPQLRNDIADQQSLTAQVMPLVHHILEAIHFSEVIQHYCGDAGDVPVEVIVETLVHARLSNSAPVPLSRVMEWVADTILPYLLDVDPSKLNDERLGRVLAKVGADYQAMWVQLVLYADQEYDLELRSGAIYDRTAIYFEGDYTESTIAKHGKSKDGKRDCKQISLGLNVTRKHTIPVLYDVLPGNTTDCTTVIENMRGLRDLAHRMKIAFEDVIIDGDSGMLTPEIMRAYVSAGVGYIGTMQESPSHRKVMDSISDEQLFQNPLSYTSSRPTKPTDKFYAVRTQMTIPALKRGKKIDADELTQTAIVVLSMPHRLKDQTERAQLCTKLERRLLDITSYLNKNSYCEKRYAQDQLDKTLKANAKAAKYLDCKLSGEDKNLSLHWQWNQEALDAESFYDGKQLVFTNRPDLSDQDIFARHKQRDGVEKRIGTTKGPLTVRPMFLHNDDRILGLTFVVMVSLLVGSLIELRLKRADQGLTMTQVERLYKSHNGSLLVFKDGSQIAVFGPGTSRMASVLRPFGLQARAIPMVVTAAWAKKLAQARGERNLRL